MTHAADPLMPRCLPISGSPHELGLSQGRALRSALHASFADLADIEAFRLRKPRLLPFSLFRTLAAYRAQRNLDPATLRDSPALRQRLHGLAEGAGIPARNLWLIQAMEAVLGTIESGDSLPAPVPGACSTIAVRGDHSLAGEPVLVHNFDYIPAVQPYYFIRETRPAGEFHSLDFAVAPLAGAIDGLNQAGLAITYNYAFTTDASAPAPTISMRIAEMLARCDTVASAIAYLRERSRWGGALLMMADRSGDIASVEVSSTRLEVRRPADGQDLLMHTNKFQCAGSQAVELRRDALYDQTAPAAVRGIPVHESAILRDARFAELLGPRSPLSPDDLAAIMADHGPLGVPSLNTPCTHGPVWSTNACLQLFPVSGRMRVSFSSACQAEYHEFELGQSRVHA